MKKLIVSLSAFVMITAFNSGNKKTLCNAYENYFPIGAAINPLVDLASDERMKFICEQYNSITPENQMKPRLIHPEENKYNWGPADKIVNFAKKNNLLVRGHTLVWHQNAPGWLVLDGENLVSKKVLLEKMKLHITNVVNRYKDNVYCWDVVNEAISDKPNEIFREKDTLYKIAGVEYIETAFKAARQADNKAQLFYNDYRFTDPVKRKKIYDLLKHLKDKGVPIDGVGMQSHYTPDEITEEYLQETIDMFSKLGLKIQVTELDVSIYNYRNKKGNDMNLSDTLYTEERQKKQALTYEMLFKVYRKNKDKITGVTFWGTSDMRKNFRSNKIGKVDYPFIFNENLQPKEVFNTITNF